MGIGFLLGLCLTLLSMRWPTGSAANLLLLTLGAGLVSTALISIVLDLIWSKARIDVEKQNMQPVFDRFDELANRLKGLHALMEGTLDRVRAFEVLGLKYWNPSRVEALTRFLKYAKELVGTVDEPCDASLNGAISVVSSSARGLIGHLDREPQSIQREWRELIRKHPSSFRILLTHPAYAHLRQPAEERSTGDIELEILKTAIFLHCVAKMNEAQLRLYRGSPTVFTIKVHQHILLNPYPYGKMAMDTLCLEFESAEEASYIGSFLSMHFNHTWAFVDQDSKLVDGRPLVTGIGSFQDILNAFAECTYLGDPKRLRLASPQVLELDHFMRNQGGICADSAKSSPFMGFVRANGMRCADEDLRCDSEPQEIVSALKGKP